MKSALRTLARARPPRVPGTFATFLRLHSACSARPTRPAIARGTLDAQADRARFRPVIPHLVRRDHRRCTSWQLLTKGSIRISVSSCAFLVFGSLAYGSL